MRFVSTRGGCPAVGLREAVTVGLAPDGGLYTPEELPPLPASFLESLDGRDQTAIAQDLAAHLLGDDLDRARLDAIVEDSLDFPVPLVEVEEGIFCLELFWGPTLAFKDVGARFMAQLMRAFRDPDDPPLTVLAATSGDTGAAVADAFHHLDGFSVVVLYPRGQVSEVQQKLFTTLGGNVECLEIDGSFDDCQRLVKEAFGDQELRERRPLASANSINIGRLLPQIFYYFFASSQRSKDPGQVVYSTPSGNFGNLTAGLMAKRIGLPCRGFVAATNVNDSVPRYLESGHFEPRPSRATLANAMDVGDPSNVSRIRHLYGDDVDALRRDLRGSRHDDGEIMRVIASVHRDTGYLLDPHSAIGYLALGSLTSKSGGGVFLATAHPAKFPDTVARATGREVPLPPRLEQVLRSPGHSHPLPPTYSAFRDHLTAGEI